LGNEANGEAATVPGGNDNLAKGDYSFAAGRRAKANYKGCFVWGDSHAGDVACDDQDQWVARASGGVVFYTNTARTSGVEVGAGGNAWTAASDRNLKENIEELDYVAVLKRLVAGVPVTTWNYRSEDPAVRHMGPMGQDFYGTFGLGDGETHISTVDADGVALAAIQGLYAQNQELKGQVQDLESRLAALEALLASHTRDGAGGGP
jgi:hypothetical protein